MDFGGRLDQTNSLGDLRDEKQMNRSSQDVVRMAPLTAILICPDDHRRRGLVGALAQNHTTVIREFAGYPSPNHFRAEELECDIALVDLDADQDVALDLIESLCGMSSSLIVMACSRSQNPELLVRCMRAGAREFLTDPPAPQALAEALVRASARRMEDVRKKTAVGKVLVFWGAKGGAGVTTLASNFAVSLKRESARQVMLMDLHLQLGDVAVLLGIKPQFTILDALNSGERLDRDLVSSLITEHKSGLAVLAAADAYTPAQNIHNGNLSRLLYVARDQYPYIVVDAGAGLGASADVLFELADAVYLVTQVDIPSLRNAQRIYSYLEATCGERVQVVLNRFDPRKDEIDEERIAKAVGVTAQWKVPSDYAGVRRSQNLGEPLVGENSAIARVVHQMARAACGKAVEGEGKRRFTLFR